MKFVSESEQVFPHSTLSPKPDSKPFEYHDNGLDSTELKSENSFLKEYQNGAFCDSKTNEEVADYLPYTTNDDDSWTARKLYHSQSLDDLANDNEKDVQDREAPDSHSCGEMESFEESVFYMDKSVTECELPELIVCYNESTYHVKDICIDEGVPSQDRILFESNVDEKGACACLPPEEDRNGELMEEKRSSVVSLPDVLKSSVENDSDKDIANQFDSSQESDSDKDIVDRCDSKDLIPSGEVKDEATEEVKDEDTEEITNDISRKLFSLKDLLALHNLSTENSHSSFSNNDDIEAEKESSQGSSGKAALANPALACMAEESNTTEEAIPEGSDVVPAYEESKNIGGEAILSNPDLVSAAEKVPNNSEEASWGSLDLLWASEESTKTSTVDKLSYNSKMETGSITFDFDASDPAARSKEQPLQSGDSEYIETPGTSRLEDTPRQSVSSRVHSGLRESSFSASGPLPALITYSGPIAYSGNISLRSDSSTTSARSFAFPVLQSEWNSSPVRMAKVDRRHYRKRKCWRHALLCCRF